MFAGFYQHLSRGQLLGLLRGNGFTIAEVEVMREAAPEELVRERLGRQLQVCTLMDATMAL